MFCQFLTWQGKEREDGKWVGAIILFKGGAYFKYLGERGAIIWGRQGMALIQGNTVGNVQTRTVNSSVTLTRLEIILSLEKAHR